MRWTTYTGILGYTELIDLAAQPLAKLEEKTVADKGIVRIRNSSVFMYTGTWYVLLVLENKIAHI